MKKAMVYSILTIMLLGTITVGAITFMQRTTSIDEIKSQGFISSKFLRLQSTIATDYMEMTGVDIERVSSETMELNHSFSLSEDEPMTHFLMNEYIYYIENHYASSLNLNLSFNLTPVFNIMPMDYSIERTYTNYTANLGEGIERIDVIGYLNEDEDYINETITQFHNGSTHVTIKLYNNESKTNQLYWFNGSIDLSGENLFSIRFNSSDRGTYNGNGEEDTDDENGDDNVDKGEEGEDKFLEFIFEAENDNIKIRSINGLNSTISLNYGFSRDKSKIYLNTGTHINMKTYDERFEKTGPIVLMSG